MSDQEQRDRVKICVDDGSPPLHTQVHGNDENGSTHLFWKIRCIDTQSKAFFDRCLYLETSTLPPEKRRSILSLCTAPANPRIVQYRSLFREVDDAEITKLQEVAYDCRTFSASDYFEDENGQCLDPIRIAEILSGISNPILMGNVESVLRQGPAEMRQKDKWSAEKANNIANYLRIVEQIASSDWYKHPLSVEYAVTKNADIAKSPDFRDLLDSKAPGSQAIKEVLLPLRQLYASDDAFNFACNDYLQHADHPGKRAWVELEKKTFGKIRSGQPHFCKIDNLTVQEVLDIFMYGSQAVHRKSKDNLESVLAAAVKKYGTKYVVASFKFSMRELLQHPFTCYYVIKQDFDYWVTTLGVAGPTVLSLADLDSK